MMQGGLLAGLTDPVLMAEVAERNALAAILAERWGCTLQAAREWLNNEDSAARELFAIGNTVPRNILH